jgi:hypothetical protein
MLALHEALDCLPPLPVLGAGPSLRPRRGWASAIPPVHWSDPAEGSPDALAERLAGNPQLPQVSDVVGVTAQVPLNVLGSATGEGAEPLNSQGI